MRKKILIFPVCILVHFLILYFTSYTPWPEMLSYPYLINNGYVPYKDIIFPYPPLLPFILSRFFGYFGLSLINLKLLTYFFILILDFIYIKVSLKLFGYKKSALGLVIFILLQVVLEGNGLWFDLAMTPLILAVFYLLGDISPKKGYRTAVMFLAGLLTACAFMIKQTALITLVPLVILQLISLKKESYRAIGLFCMVFVLAIIFFSFMLVKPGIMGDYISWVYLSPFRQVKSLGFTLLPTVKQSAVWIILLALSLYGYYVNREEKVRKIFIWVIILQAFALPRFSYFHLQPSLPFISLTLTGLIFYHTNRNKYFNAITIFALPLVIFGYFMIKNFKQETRFFNSKNLISANIINKYLAKENYTFYYNIDSQYMVVSKTLPVKPWADTYPWYLETSGLQDRIVRSLKANSIRTIFYKPFAREGRFIPGSYRPEIIDKYIWDNYQIYDQIDSDLWVLRKKTN